jgi:hypothetical protein
MGHAATAPQTFRATDASRGDRTKNHKQHTLTRAPPSRGRHHRRAPHGWHREQLLFTVRRPARVGGGERRRDPGRIVFFQLTESDRAPTAREAPP